jgi:CheY-like chemotaxis protein
MIPASLPCCLYPTSVILVDDDSKFAKSFGLWLDQSYPCREFTKPYEALSYIKALRHNPFLNRCVVQLEEVDVDERNVKVNIRAIHQEVFNPNRHKELSVIVVDYNMPDMDGIEFCRQLAGIPNIKKLMLTGEADNTIAVEAFNNGLIDKFIKKDSNSSMALHQSVLNAVYELQLKYFLDLSRPVIDSMRNSPEKMPACFNDPEFSAWFYALLRQHKFVEFYLIENQANFLLLTKHGKISWLVVRDKQEMADIAQFADDMIDDKPTEEERNIINQIRLRKTIPFFYSEDDYKTAVQDWAKYMQPCTELKTGQNTYYYSLIESKSIYSIDANRIKSFGDCQDE